MQKSDIEYARQTNQNNMKAKLLLTVAAMSFALCSFAESTTPTIVKSTYYGTKARNNYANPCKGETVRVCGIIEKEITPVNGITVITETITDENSFIINNTTSSTSATTNEVVIDLVNTTPSNAIIEVIQY